MKLALIVAQSENRVIGRNNKLPWHLPEDLKYFKSVTMGKVIIMGRKTFESIGRPLPGRTNIVVTRNLEYSFNGVDVVHDLQAAIEKAESLSIINGWNEALVIGGSQLYEQALPLTERLYLTQVHHQVDGDAYFPALNSQDWEQVGSKSFKSDDVNPYNYSFLVFNRKSTA
ncbi:dihydrofolate reductase [Motiliproteus sp. MSK22-1]|nr:dihydrofolate reductase [Motiliproteus sp. MSK22-1]OMH39197.1 dihydrofolate reductase [Motiliproteus sp. MSK22-1]